MSYFCWKLFAVSDGYFQDIMLYLKRKLTDLVLVESKVNYLKDQNPLNIDKSSCCIREVPNKREESKVLKNVGLESIDIKQ